jgi:hypothetical protein
MSSVFYHTFLLRFLLRSRPPTPWFHNNYFIHYSIEPTDNCLLYCPSVFGDARRYTIKSTLIGHADDRICVYAAVAMSGDLVAQRDDRCLYGAYLVLP